MTDFTHSDLNLDICSWMSTCWRDGENCCRRYCLKDQPSRHWHSYFKSCSFAFGVITCARAHTHTALSTPDNVPAYPTTSWGFNFWSRGTVLLLMLFSWPLPALCPQTHRSAEHMYHISPSCTCRQTQTLINLWPFHQTVIFYTYSCSHSKSTLYFIFCTCQLKRSKNKLCNASSKQFNSCASGLLF